MLNTSDEQRMIGIFELGINPDEVRNVSTLLGLLKDFYEKAFSEKSKDLLNYIKVVYRDYVGFYAYCENDQGTYTILNGFPTLEIEDAFYLIIKDSLFIDFLNNNIEVSSNPDIYNYYNEYLKSIFNIYYNGDIPDNINKYFVDELKRVK